MLYNQPTIFVAQTESAFSQSLFWWKPEQDAMIWQHDKLYGCLIWHFYKFYKTFAIFSDFFYAFTSKFPKAKDKGVNNLKVFYKCVLDLYISRKSVAP